ncbi:MAG: hypothetical protein E7653_00130 [Ruminococcaceae bacterium]|nr:hypothetical protein [Oscillospiraceae bacterium]
MRKSEKNAILQKVAFWNDEKLESEYYKAVYDSLGSQTDRMYDLGYDMRDIIEREKTEKFNCEYADLLGFICEQRGIVLWKDKKKE